MSIIIPGSFPARRLRRSRTHSFSRRLVAENQLTVNDLILPVFIIEGQNLRQEVPSMPGVFRLSVDMLLHDAAQFVQAGIPAIALFPCIESSAKSLMADASWDPSGLVPRTVRALKKAFPELGVITDVALDAYTSHGQDGITQFFAIITPELEAVRAPPLVTFPYSHFPCMRPFRGRYCRFTLKQQRILTHDAVYAFGIDNGHVVSF